MNIWQWIGLAIAYWLTLYGLIVVLMLAEDCIEKLDRAKHQHIDNEWDNFYRRER